ncbi:MAG: 50S ribosomal protein L3 [Verrucomicrobiae bacterium]|nr:50S ribosomal protein L3 [Verrucomicrobiae bacterium]
MELLGKKIGMTQVFDAKGNFIGVTVIEVGPCTVLQKKDAKSDGYNAVQLGFGTKKERTATKPMLGHCKKANAAPAAHIREYRTPEPVAFNVGDKITVKEFQPGQFVDVIGTSKGKGFQGVVRRHKFAGGDMTHGAKGWHRRSGAIGQRLFPGRVFKNMRMPGHMGHTKITTQNLKVVQVREADNVLLIQGAVPGHTGALVVVRHAIKKTKAA